LWISYDLQPERPILQAGGEALASRTSVPPTGRACFFCTSSPSATGNQQSMVVPLFRLPVLFALAAGARRRAFVDAGCRCQPARALRPNCPVGKLPADMDYRRTGGALPLAMCIGDSVSGPSCRAAAAALADRLELRSVEFPRASGGKVLLNGMTSANVRKCMGSWMGSVPWRAVIFGAGAWDLQTNGCCETDAAHLQVWARTCLSLLTYNLLCWADLTSPHPISPRLASPRLTSPHYLQRIVDNVRDTVRTILTR
jgi:hypothetical protein